MKKSYSIFVSDEQPLPVTPADFFKALNAKDENDNLLSLYHWYNDGEYSFTEHKYIRGRNNYLLPKSSKRLSESYRIHHNDIERQRQQDIRRAPLGIITVPINDECGGEEYENTLVDEQAESEIHNGAESGELLDHLHRVLHDLKELDREVVTLLYGLGGQAPMSKTACSEALNKNWRTVDRAEQRVLSKLRVLLADFADYGN